MLKVVTYLIFVAKIWLMRKNSKKYWINSQFNISLNISVIIVGKLQ